MRATDHDWVILLAGGEGSRLRGWRGPDGAEGLPKQFRRILGERSLLRAALARARHHAPCRRIVPVVSAGHRAWWEPECGAIDRNNILVQGSDRGTGVALLAATVLIMMRDPAAVLVSFPADHAVGDEKLLAAGVRSALRAADANPDRLVLLGVAPDGEDDDFGWIIPGDDLPGGARRVLGFEEKPAAGRTARLRTGGALVDTFILAARGRAMMSLFHRRRPEVVDRLLTGLIDSGPAPAAVTRHYESLPPVDFGRDLLEHESDRLAVVTAPACGWADLGTPARIERWLQAQTEPESAGRPARRSS